MRIITYACPVCGTVVAANELESGCVMKCPGLGCEEVHRFEDLDAEEQEHFLKNREKYQM